MELDHGANAEAIQGFGSAPGGSGDELAGFALSPDGLRGWSERTQRLAVNVDGFHVDPSLLADAVVGHVGLAQSLRDFVEELELRRTELWAHVANLRAAVDAAAARYRSADEDVADHLTTPRQLQAGRQQDLP